MTARSRGLTARPGLWVVVSGAGAREQLACLSRRCGVRELLQAADGPAGLLAVLDNRQPRQLRGARHRPGEPQPRRHGRLIDCSHETFPFELPGVCDSLWELLRLVLDSNGEDWSWPAVLRYGVDFAELDGD